MMKYITLLTVLFFTATWCYYCRIMEPIVYKLKTEGYDITIVDYDSNLKLVKKHGITMLPTLWVNGTKHTGAKTIDQYREYMK